MDTGKYVTWKKKVKNSDKKDYEKRHGHRYIVIWKKK